MAKKKQQIRFVSIVVVPGAPNGIDRSNSSEIFGLDANGKVWRYRTTLIDPSPAWTETQFREKRHYQWVEPSDEPNG